MRDTELYRKILGLEDPWRVTEVVLDTKGAEVQVHVRHPESKLPCPLCAKRCPRHDTRHRRWRHLDTCQYRTLLVAEVPRIDCPEHGVHQVRVPWAEPGSRFTALFEALVIDWLQAATTQAVARQLQLSWDQVDGVMQRAVRRGLARRQLTLPRTVGVDETSFQKRHEYVTVVADLQLGVVQHIADGRGKEALGSYFSGFSADDLEHLETIAMDMSGAFIAATREAVPDADAKIAFDKFHVAMHLGQAVDRVRREENRVLRQGGDETLAGTRHLWLYHPEHLPEDRVVQFADLVKKTLKTARAWSLKELAMDHSCG